MRALILALLLASAAMAQPVNPPPAVIKGNPPGGIGAACSGTPLLGYLNASGQVITCPASHVWTVTGGLALPACSSTVTSNCVVTASAAHNVELYVPCGAQAPAGSLCINAAAFDADMSDGRLEVQGPANAARPVASFGYVNRASGSTTASQVLYLTAYNGGSGTIDALRSDYRDIENYGGGSVADAVSNYTFYGNTLGSSVGNFYGSWIDTSNAGSLVNFYGSYIAKPSATGTTTNSYGQWIGDFAGFGTNPYYSWFDSRGVRRVKEDSSFDSVGQAIEALYNPLFAKYTAGAVDFERVVLGRWNGNVAEIGAENGGTGTLRALNLIGSSVTAPTPTALDNSNKVATTEFVNSAVGGANTGMVLVEEHTASGSASLNFTSCITATYDNYKIMLVNLIPAGTTSQIGMRFSTDGGSNYDSGANYAWNRWAFRPGGGATAGNAGVTSLVLADAGNWATSNSGVVGDFTMFGPGSSSLYKQVTGTASGIDATEAITMTIGGSYRVATAANAFQVFFGSGNIASGTVRCYGLSK